LRTAGGSEINEVYCESEALTDSPARKDRINAEHGGSVREDQQLNSLHQMSRGI
jgi:hypothetical protein